MNKKLLLLLILFLLITCLSACGGRNSTQTTSSAYNIGLEVGSLEVGKTTLFITIHDAEDNLINDAIVSIKGDMTHAGMQPVLGETSTATNGIYSIPYEWTMAGDWIITIDVTFADGTHTSQRFDFNGIGS